MVTITTGRVHELTLSSSLLTPFRGTKFSPVQVSFLRPDAFPIHNSRAKKELDGDHQLVGIRLRRSQLKSNVLEPMGIQGHLFDNLYLHSEAELSQVVRQGHAVD